MSDKAKEESESHLSLQPGSLRPTHPHPKAARPAPTVAEYVQGILKRDRSLLARAVTLIESQAPAHQAKAREVLQAILPHTGQSVRIGITGYPGAGKSTLIETLGCHLIDQGHRVAVLAIDPSSARTRGSILGDKTRMEALTRRPEAFIRPSPSGGALGGVTRKSRETLLLCEAAGFDVILVETVGVGQNEITVRQMVDFYLLVMIAGAGDELQGIKKGVIEMADALLFNKADGDNKRRSEQARQEFALALKYLSAYTPDWEVPVLTASAREQVGIAELWQTCERFLAHSRENGFFEQQRQQQRVEWLREMLQEAVLTRFLQTDSISERYDELQQCVASGQIWAPEALSELLNLGFSPETGLR